MLRLRLSRTDLLTVRIDEDKKVTPTTTAVVNENQAVVAPGAPVVENDTDIMIDQPDAQAFVFDPGVELSSIVDTMNGVGATPADLVAILEALRQAGALRAELVII